MCNTAKHSNNTNFCNIFIIPGLWINIFNATADIGCDKGINALNNFVT